MKEKKQRAEAQKKEKPKPTRHKKPGAAQRFFKSVFAGALGLAIAALCVYLIVSFHLYSFLPSGTRLLVQFLCLAAAAASIIITVNWIRALFSEESGAEGEGQADAEGKGLNTG